jgi:hypothetical protein
VFEFQREYAPHCRPPLTLIHPFGPFPSRTGPVLPARLPQVHHRPSPPNTQFHPATLSREAQSWLAGCGLRAFGTPTAPESLNVPDDGESRSSRRRRPG